MKRDRGEPAGGIAEARGKQSEILRSAQNDKRRAQNDRRRGRFCRRIPSFRFPVAGVLISDANLIDEKFPQYPVSTSPIEVGSTVIIEIRIVRVSSSGL